MAIKFEFILNDMEAENLFQWLQESVCKCHDSILDEMVKQGVEGEDREAYIKWYRSHIKYIEAVKARMLEKQTRIDDSPEFEVYYEDKDATD